MGHRRHRSHMNYAVLRTAPPFLSYVMHHDVHWTRLSNLVIRCERKKRSFPLCCGVAPSHLPAPFVQCWCAVWDGAPCEKNAHFRHSWQVPDDNIDLGGGGRRRGTPQHTTTRSVFFARTGIVSRRSGAYRAFGLTTFQRFKVCNKWPLHFRSRCRARRSRMCV